MISVPKCLISSTLDNISEVSAEHRTSVMSRLSKQSVKNVGKRSQIEKQLQPVPEEQTKAKPLESDKSLDKS